MTHHITDEQIVAAAAWNLGECVVENCGLGDIKDFARAVLALAAPQGEPYGWAVTGCHSLYRGEWAESTARAEAKRCGGTARAFPLYTAPAPAVPSDERAAFELAMKESWQMVDPLRPPPAGSYYAGEHAGICAALKTVRENFTRHCQKSRAALTAAPTPPAQPKCLTCNGHGLIGGHMQDGSGYGEGCPDCNPGPAVPESADPFLVRDIAEMIGSSVPDVCKALVELGYPQRSTNMEIPRQEAVAVAQRLRPAVQESADGAMPMQLGELAKRNVYDAIRGAYDLGYNDARNARAVPGDSAPGYDGRNVEADHGGALLNSLNQRLRSATATPAVPEDVAWEPLKTSAEGREAVALFFSNVLRRHDFGDYIRTKLAADFACALGGYLGAARSARGVPEDVARLDALGTPGWELSKNDDPECQPDELWQVHSVSGGRNDREWTLIGSGANPRAAIDAARAAEKGGE